MFGAQTENVSQGLFPDGNTNTHYFMTNWTPRAANTLSGPLRITELFFNGGAVTLTWSAIPGRNYRVLFKNNLDAPTWTPLPAGEVLAAGGTASINDFAPANTHRFYRVERAD